MRSGELEADTGRRILFAWMTNGYWDGADAVVKAPGLPKDSLSLPRDITFAADGRLLQKFVPELHSYRISTSHETLTSTQLSARPLWLQTAGRQLEIVARFNVKSNATFGMYVLSSKDLSEVTVLGIDLVDDVVFMDRRNSSGTKPFVASRGVLDVRAGLLPTTLQNRNGGATVIDMHAIVDGPIVTFIVGNETALSAFVYPQLASSVHVALWSSVDGAVRASADVWQLRSPFLNH
jgi:sucrose-6-phosphate hydrolase SacC (GH32 family)